MGQRKVWMPRKPKPKLDDSYKNEIKTLADKIIEGYLKPKFLVPIPAEQKWNHLVDIYSKWHQNFFYFCSTYKCPAKGFERASFESRFVRLECIGRDAFNLSYYRHTGQWWEVSTERTLSECLREIQEDGLGIFRP